tara:strand:- start:383 stop:520 length:138 start_codon:yes stop_codon:yes gene_type:complete
VAHPASCKAIGRDWQADGSATLSQRYKALGMTIHRVAEKRFKTAV